MLTFIMFMSNFRVDLLDLNLEAACVDSQVLFEFSYVYVNGTYCSIEGGGWRR